jgi:hypothetical protein
VIAAGRHASGRAMGTRLAAAGAVALATMFGFVGWPAGASDETEMSRVGAYARATDDPGRADSAYAALGRELATLGDSTARAFAFYLRMSAARTLGRMDSMARNADSCYAYKPDDGSALSESAPAGARGRAGGER